MDTDGPRWHTSAAMPRRTVFFTICSNNYLAQAEVFFRSVRDHHPDVDRVLGLADRRHPDDAYPAGVEVIEAEALDIADFASFAFAYDIMELNTAIKPHLMLRLLARGYDDVVYFDPDIALYRRLDDLLDILAGGASFVLTPHCADPPSAGARRNERHLLQTGAYNLGFLAASRHPETVPALRWWARQLRHDCRNDQSQGLFVDQKYMDLLPGLVDHARVLRDTTFNAAYWNLPQRRLAAAAEGSWTIDGRALAFFHFSGFEPERPDQLSRYAPGPLASHADPAHADAARARALADLLGDYAARRRRARPSAPIRPYAYGAFTSGVPIPDMVRRMFRERHPTWSGDPFRDYDRYSRLPSPRAALGALGETVTNLMHYHHQRTAAFRFAFNLDNPLAVTAYARAFARVAAAENLDPRLWKAAS